MTKKQIKLDNKEVKKLKEFVVKNNIGRYSHYQDKDFKIKLTKYKDYSLVGLVCFIVGICLFCQVIGDPIDHWEEFKKLDIGWHFLFSSIGIITVCYILYKFVIAVWEQESKKRLIISIIERNPKIEKAYSYSSNLNPTNN